MRNYYRIAITTACTLAAFVGPIIFLEDRPRVGYLLGGFAAAVLARYLLVAMIALEHHIPTWLRGVLGGGAALLSWAPISLVAVFDVIPNMATNGFNRFDPVWIAGGVLAPLTILGLALLKPRKAPLLDVVLTALYRYSFPLVGLDLLARIPNLPKQYPWLFLFTGTMFLTLDILVHGVEPIPHKPAKVHH